MKYLLSTGLSTSKIEYYIIDLFKLYLSIYPGDIPGASGIGFNFILTDTKKDELVSEVKYRVESLVNKIKEKFGRGIAIEIESLEIIDETRANLIIRVDQIRSDNILIDLYEM